MNPLKIEESILIQQPPETIFDFTQDYSKRLIWDTFLIKADLINGATAAAKGVRAYCVAKNRLGMVTEYITFNRPSVTAIKMTKGPFMFSSFVGSWRFKPLTGGTTEVIFTYSFTFRFPFVLLAQLIQRHLRRNVRQRLADLKHHMEVHG